MSLLARNKLVSSDKIAFENASDKTDLLDPELTQTYLIAALLDVTAVWPILITAVRSDHPTPDGLHGHQFGWCADFVFASNSKLNPTSNTNPALYIAAKALSSPWIRGTGLGGEYKTLYRGVTLPAMVFDDNDETHIHIQTYGDEDLPLKG